MIFIRYVGILFFLLHVSLVAKDMDKIRISPLPMADSMKTAKIFSPFIRHVSTMLNKELEMIHYNKYDDIIDSLDKNFLDLAYLGPLPFASIRLRNPNIIPVVGFYESNGQKGYACVVAHTSFDRVDLKNLKNKTIALTQPLSTCGYFMASQLLKKVDENLSIEDMKYKYIGTHTGVVENVIRGNFLLGGMKDSVALKYASMGLEVAESSNLLPSFILVANENTLSKELISSLRKGLLETPKDIYSYWGDKISHGMFEVSQEDFQEIMDVLSTMNIPQKGNF